MDNEEKPACETVGVGAGPIVPATRIPWWQRHPRTEMLAHLSALGWIAALLTMLAIGIVDISGVGR